MISSIRNPKLVRTFSLSRASLTGLVARAMVPDWLESAIAINLAKESAEIQSGEYPKTNEPLAMMWN